MNRVAANYVLSAELAAFRELGYEQLIELAGDEMSIIRRGFDGLHYTVEIAINWINEKREVQVSGKITPSDWGSPHDRLDDTFVVSKI